MDIKTNILNIISHYKNIKYEISKLNEIEDNIKEYQKKIDYIKDRINMIRNEINCIYIPDKDYQISQIEKERDRIINDLDNQYTYYTVRRKRFFFFFFF